MNGRYIAAGLILGFSSLAAHGQTILASMAEPETAAAQTGWELGTRITHYTFVDDTKGKKFEGSYIGSLYQIKDDQNDAPTKRVAQYFFTPYFGAGASYEEVRAVTWDGGGTDGTIELKGPIAYLIGRMPDYDLIRPYAELGLAFYSASFDYDRAWYEGGRRQMGVDDSVGLSLGLGADILLSERWSLNLMARYTEASVDATVYVNGNSPDHGNFKMDYYSYGIGAKYCF